MEHGLAPLPEGDGAPALHGVGRDVRPDDRRDALSGKIIVRPSVLGDFAALGLDAPEWRVRALTAEKDGEILGLGGIAYLPAGGHAAFVHAKPESRQYRVTFHKVGLSVLKEAKRLGIPRLVAYADPEIDRAEAWLRRLGFEQEVIANEQVWIWRSSSH